MGRLRRFVRYRVLDGHAHDTDVTSRVDTAYTAFDGLVRQAAQWYTDEQLRRAIKAWELIEACEGPGRRGERTKVKQIYVDELAGRGTGREE